QRYGVPRYILSFPTRRSSDLDTALKNAFAHTGMAMLFTSVVIAAGFAVFGFSSFLPSVYFGLLTAAAMIIALAADLTILPALLRSEEHTSELQSRENLVCRLL